MFLGLYLSIVGFRALSLNLGDLLVLFAAVLLGFSHTFAKKLMIKKSSSLVADTRLIGGGVIFLAIGFIVGENELVVTSAGLWPLVSGFILWLNIKLFYAAIQNIGANKAVVISNSHPVMTPVIGIIILAESYSWVKFIGSLIIIVSIYFISSNRPINSKR